MLMAMRSACFFGVAGLASKWQQDESLSRLQVANRWAMSQMWPPDAYDLSHAMLYGIFESVASVSKITYFCIKVKRGVGFWKAALSGSLGSTLCDVSFRLELRLARQGKFSFIHPGPPVLTAFTPASRVYVLCQR